MANLVPVHPRELAPTQPTIGRFEVSLKAERFRLMSPRDLDGYLDEKRSKDKGVQVVKGQGRFWVVDGHHTLTALDTLPEVRVLHLEQLEDWTGLEEDDFWERMRDGGWVLERGLGVPVAVKDFPSRLGELTDDPFRSLAWLIRKMGAFEDFKQPYQEFTVADFLREHMVFKPQMNHEYELAALRAYELMRSEEAEKAADDEPLLGFLSRDLDDDLVASYYAVLEKARAPRYYGR